MNRKVPLQSLIEAAVMAALAFILDLIPAINIGPWMSVSIAMLPIFLVSIRWGWRVGMASGFIWGLLQIALGDAYILTPLQAFIEYFIAFSFVGLAGLLSNRSLSARSIVLAVLIGSIARYFWHFIAGWVYFAEYAPEGMPAALYSLIVNGGTALLTFILCAIVLILLWKTAPRLLKKT
ncbi:energy-coupled thiamine transporter ThiT [Domibacillus iocasae]|uniref:Energy-coupled thiamine transporter ThiT n=1 Tax=Domibacillus iocasae TaxID=1714016 RepID=A0A1E7DLD0_9BACI|nr:energy-coupled thiamine transporter ThiT [Domibacillus iocasae]OES43892.1 energy-coupled thiamine transporter ThiT [Domibacillus iocasae]